MTGTCILVALKTLGRSGVIAILTVSMLLGATAVRAEEDVARGEEEEEPSQRDELMDVSCRDQEDRPDSWLDRTHSYLNQRLCEPAAWFDGFFGDDRALEETPVGTFFRLRNEVRWDQSEDLRARVRLS
ncbi:MAG TPA: hypothetical protein DCR65_11480, partial [Gammaproteobacteria bacterium]|nr:hypothetical protein [Gammaproteobacteria bacterium]